jgi:ectoine hydroxylase-related dioxygenase (phytanoyl-CoA dioxygenase family)
MDTNTMRDELRTRGFTVVRNLLDDDEVAHYVDKMENLSGIKRSDFASRGGKSALSNRGLNTSWSQPDGVSQNRDFWDLIFHEHLTSIVKEIVDPDIKYLQHNDLHVGFSAISWHRDSVCREFMKGPDWDEEDEPYRLVRVGIYLQNYAESGFRLGFVPGSHLPLPEVTLGRKLTEAKLKWIGALSYAFTKLQQWASNAEWVATEPGDAIIFDPRIQHSGSYIVGPKYSMFVAYGLENKHFYNHFNYYTNIREELGYRPMPSELVDRLMMAGLYQEHTPVLNEIEGVWTPTPLLKNIYSRKTKGQKSM